MSEEQIIHPIEPAEPDATPVPPAPPVPVEGEPVAPTPGGIDLTDPILEVITNPHI